MTLNGVWGAFVFHAASSEAGYTEDSEHIRA
jgi:hypothetical protein